MVNNWINNVVPPKIRSFLTKKREVPDDLWRKCPETGQMVFHKDLEANQFVYPGSNYHERMTGPQRLAHIFDGGSYDKVAVPTVAQDPLKFRDGKRYTDRLKDARANTELDDAVLVGEGTLDGRVIVAAAQDFRFMAGSLGMAAGEAVIAGMLHAVELKCPFILFAASGGARMQEGIMSLMQMPRTTIAVQRLRDARLPYIVVLTDPTTGGVTASYAMLGDIHIAEPGALICFAGPRVIQQTIREQLPDGFQRSEYLQAHGMVDMVVHRHKLRETLSSVCRLLMTSGQSSRTRKVNGKPYVNGSPLVEGKDIEAAARVVVAKPMAPKIDAPSPAGTTVRADTGGAKTENAAAKAKAADTPPTQRPDATKQASPPTDGTRRS